MRRKIADVLLVAVIIGLALVTYINNQVLDVQLYQARKGKVTTTVTMTGQVATKESKDILYSKDCLIREYFVSEGQEVKVGDALFKIDMAYDALNLTDDKAKLQMDLNHEKLALENLLKTNGYSQIEILSIDVTTLKEVYTDHQTLYKQGVVSKKALDQAKKNYESKLLTYQEALAAYEKKNNDKLIAIEKSKLKIEELRQALAVLQAEEDIFALVDQEGIYYADHKGVVKSMAEVGVVLPKKTKIMTLAVTGLFDSYLFEGHIDAEHVSLLSEGDELDMYDGVIRDPLKGRLLKVYHRVENGKVAVEAEFLEDRAAKIKYGKSFHSNKLIQPILDQVIPKNCVVNSGDYEIGDQVAIFIKEDGHAKKVSVTIEAIGDRDIGVSSEVALDQVIVDPTYKIKDGVRVR